MHDSPELPVKHDRSSDELAELIGQFAPTFDEDLPLKVLLKWDDRKYLSEEEKKHPVPKEWVDFYEKLTTNEKGEITKAMGLAIRSDLKTVGDLQEREEELSQCKLQGTVKGTIGPHSAHILYKGFALPKEQL